MGISAKAGLISGASLAGACCGGASLIMQNLRGDGMAFIGGNGCIIQKELAQGEELIVDQHAILAYTHGVQQEVRRAGTCLMMCCGADGIFNSVLRGPGTIWMQSMSITKWALIINGPPKKKKGKK